MYEKGKKNNQTSTLFSHIEHNMISWRVFHSWFFIRGTKPSGSSRTRPRPSWPPCTRTLWSWKEKNTYTFSASFSIFSWFQHSCFRHWRFTVWIDYHFLKWAIPGLLFFIFVISKQLAETNVLYKRLLMTKFEPQISDIGCDPSTNWATTTAQIDHA